jgi:putative transposase
MAVMNSPDYCGMSPKQIVPALAEKGTYLASESTMYRLLRNHKQLKHREPIHPRTPRPKPSQVATGPNQLWSWDITYLKSSVRGLFFYLYLVVDVWSRKIVGWTVEPKESAEYASDLIWQICEATGLDPAGIVLHSDNGGPMRGSTMLATLQWLGIVPSFSRPHVRDDNPYSEALFRTLKYRPSYPRRPFANIEEARAWVADFVDWYNNHHRHSGINFVTPADRHEGRHVAILKQRQKVIEQARAKHPERWTGDIRSCTPVDTVYLNPDAMEPEKAVA